MGQRAKYSRHRSRILRGPRRDPCTDQCCWIQWRWHKAGKNEGQCNAVLLDDAWFWCSENSGQDRLLIGSNEKHMRNLFTNQRVLQMTLHSVQYSQLAHFLPSVHAIFCFFEDQLRHLQHGGEGWSARPRQAAPQAWATWGRMDRRKSRACRWIWEGTWMHMVSIGFCRLFGPHFWVLFLTLARFRFQDRSWGRVKQKNTWLLYRASLQVEDLTDPFDVALDPVTSGWRNPPSCPQSSGGSWVQFKYFSDDGWVGVLFCSFFFHFFFADSVRQPQRIQRALNSRKTFEPAAQISAKSCPSCDNFLFNIVNIC